MTVLLEGGVQETQIAIITLYRQQVKLLSHMLQDYKGIEILTADKSQGRDKDCVIFSMVRSNDTASVCALVAVFRGIETDCQLDWRSTQRLEATERVVHPFAI